MAGVNLTPFNKGVDSVELPNEPGVSAVEGALQERRRSFMNETRETCGYPVGDTSFPSSAAAVAFKIAFIATTSLATALARDLDSGTPIALVLQLHASAPTRKHVDELSDARTVGEIS